MFGFNLMELVAGLPGLILALAFHEYAHARAAVRLAKEKRSGAFTILDIPASYFTKLSREELLAHWM